MLDLIAGKRRVGAVVNLANPGGNVNGQIIMAISTYAAMIGAKSMVLKRLKVRNNGAGDTWVHIGTGAAGAIVDAIPALRIIGNTTDDYSENDLPQVEFTGNIMSFVDAIVAGSLDVQVEVEERG